LRLPDDAAVRVCHVMSADLWAGAEVQVATAASYLVERPDVRMSAVLLNDGPLANELRRLGIPVVVIDEHRHNAARILIGLARYLRSHPADIVHTHRYKDTMLGACAARLAGVPCVFRTVHGWSEALRGWDRVKFVLYDALDKMTLRCLVDRIIAVSTHVAGRLEDAGCSPAAVVPLHNGVALHRIRPARARDEVRRELGIDEDTPLVGTVGRLSPVKGQAHLLQSARLVLEQQPAARFLIVGDGPLKADLIGAAMSLGIDRACLFVGARTDVYDLISAMDVFVLPSLDEGLPLALLEAMALARPVVATAVGGVPEVIAHRRTGLLVKPRDERALADACVALLSNREWADTLGTRARQKAIQEFSHERHGQALVGMYRRSVAQKAVATRPQRFWRRIA
jgi:L-malate glycosyltransferase